MFYNFTLFLVCTHGKKMGRKYQICHHFWLRRSEESKRKEQNKEGKKVSNTVMFQILWAQNIAQIYNFHITILQLSPLPFHSPQMRERIILNVKYLLEEFWIKDFLNICCAQGWVLGIFNLSWVAWYI